MEPHTTRLGREDILEAPLRTTKVDTGEWKAGSHVLIREVTGAELPEFNADLQGDNEQERNARIIRNASKWAARVMVDEQFQPVFGSEDIANLEAVSAAPLLRIVDKLAELSLSTVTARNAVSGE